MTKALISLTSFVVVLLFAIAPVSVAYAQVCSPHCAPGTICVYTTSAEGAGAPTSCTQAAQNGTVSEITVTGPSATHGPTFRTFVETTLVGFVNNYIIPLLYSIAFLLFIFGMFRYFFTGGEENREKGKAFALWALIGMVAIFSVWGLVNLFLNLIPQ